MATRTWTFLRIVLATISLLGAIAAAHATPATDWLQQQSRPDGVYQSATTLATSTQSTSEAVRALEARDLGDAPDVELARNHLVGVSACRRSRPSSWHVAFAWTCHGATTLRR